MNAPTEFKVWAGTAGAGVLTPCALWLLGVLVWGQSASADNAVAAVAAVPTPVAALIAGAITFAAGYLAPHTNRPDLAPPFELRYPPADLNTAITGPAEGRSMVEPAESVTYPSQGD